MAERPHFAFPFVRAPAGGVLVVEQDTLEHVDACCQLIVRCPAGWREERPEFGWQFPEFRNAPIDPAPVVTALQRFEPRATNVRASEWADLANDAVRHLSVDVEVG
jgi:phage baseplate assembly protein W